MPSRIEEALVNLYSISSKQFRREEFLMLTTEVMITEQPEEKNESTSDGDGHNHNWEGMYEEWAKNS